MTRDDIPALHKLPIVKIDDGRFAQIDGPKMDDNFWRITYRHDHNTILEDKPQETAVVHLSHIVGIIDLLKVDPFEELDGNGRTRA